MITRTRRARPTTPSPADYSATHRTKRSCRGPAPEAPTHECHLNPSIAGQLHQLRQLARRVSATCSNWLGAAAGESPYSGAVVPGSNSRAFSLLRVQAGVTDTRQRGHQRRRGPPPLDVSRGPAGVRSSPSSLLEVWPFVDWLGGSARQEPDVSVLRLSSPGIPGLMTLLHSGDARDALTGSSADVGAGNCWNRSGTAGCIRRRCCPRGRVDARCDANRGSATARGGRYRVREGQGAHPSSRPVLLTSSRSTYICVLPWLVTGMHPERGRQ
jgi:hypothetical protein